MRIALAQLNPLIGDLIGNAKKIKEHCRDIANQGAELILTPELSLWGYPPRDLLLNPSLLQQQDQILKDLAIDLAEKELELGLLIGIAELAPDSQLPRLFNSIALIQKGSCKVVARKQLLPTYDVFDEKRYFRPAKSSSVLNFNFNSKQSKIGITICEDLWVEEEIQGQRIKGTNPVEQFLSAKINLLINLSASPFGYSKDSLREKLAAKAAKKLNCPVIYLNQVGANDELIFDGASFVIKPTGKIVFSLSRCTESLCIWDSTIPDKHPIPALVPSEEKVFRALVLGVKDYAAKCNFKSALIGLSGGIDSALVATIATAALGSNNISSILMPSPWSSKESVEDAHSLAKRLEIETSTISIDNLMRSFDCALENTLGEFPKNTAAENLQSRIRGTLLMAIANQQKHLLLSTGNKSELAVGYCTLYGDMNGGLSVIGDLYKTSVFELCKWIDSEESYECRKSMGLKADGELIGCRIRTKAPSAELRPDQVDSDSLPDYKILDPILKALIEERSNSKELIKKGYEITVIKKVQTLLKNSEFKRRQAPPSLKVSPQAFGSGWRIPIAAKK
tara:strand:- start:810 stop:2507 length:1698 start_codon:yes stop_codon:yes gene_type:complete